MYVHLFGFAFPTPSPSHGLFVLLGYSEKVEDQVPD